MFGVAIISGLLGFILAVSFGEHTFLVRRDTAAELDATFTATAVIVCMILLPAIFFWMYTGVRLIALLAPVVLFFVGHTLVDSSRLHRFISSMITNDTWATITLITVIFVYVFVLLATVAQLAESIAYRSKSLSPNATGTLVIACLGMLFALLVLN